MAESQKKVDKKKGKKQPQTFSQKFWAEVRGYAEALAIAFVVVTFLFNTVGVVGSSMQPNLDGGNGRLPESLFTGDRVFIPKYDTWLRRLGILPNYQHGEVVVVREPPNAPSAMRRPDTCIQRLVGLPCRPFFIKRLIAVEGDTIKIEQGQIIVNGIAIDQSFITDSGEIHPDPIDFPIVVVEDGQITKFQGLSPSTYALSSNGVRTVVSPTDINDEEVQFFYKDVVDNFEPLPADVVEGVPFVHAFRVPEGHVFVSGDNRESAKGGSEDSRYFGPIPTITVAGRATAIIWPPMRDGGLYWQILRPPEAFKVLNQ